MADKFKEATFDELVRALQKLNPGAQIDMGNPETTSDYGSTIFCNVPINQLVLPESFYYNEKKWNYQ